MRCDRFIMYAMYVYLTQDSMCTLTLGLLKRTNDETAVQAVIGAGSLLGRPGHTPGPRCVASALLSDAEAAARAAGATSATMFAVVCSP